MPDPAQVSPQVPSIQTTLQKIFRKFTAAILRALVCCGVAQVALADSVTYQQLQQRQERRPRVAAEAPPVVPAQNQDQQNKQGQNQPAQSGQSQSGVAQESLDHPEFVRLPDGRIVRYGPGILCDENCVEPVTPEAFREPGPRMWWLIPAVSGAALCAFLCRGNDEPKPTPTIIIPPINPPPVPVVSPTAPPAQPSPEVPEVPEPGTLALFGLGIGAMIARRLAARKEKN
jgi:hypothetical protein